LCNRFAKGIDVNVVCEAAPSVDFDDREPLPVLRLERFVARDVDLAQQETELRLQLPDLRERPLAEVATLRVIDDDVGSYG
jgi:hypothetical protein